jgi:hypothetical protein
MNRASMIGASMVGANMNRASMVGASMDGANMDGANIKRILQVGPVGSRKSYLVCFQTDKGIKINAGCWWGTDKEFVARVTKVHGDTIYAKEYTATIKFIQQYFKLYE